MSRPDWRNLPPVEPIDRPGRLSQTVLKHANTCMRSAYLYLKHGSAPSVELDRGTAFHTVAERGMWTLIEHDEPNMEPDVVKDLVELVLDENPHLGVTAEDAMHLRQQAYHWAVGFDPRPSEVVAIERMFTLEVEGWTIVGKVDLARIGADLVLDVVDYKTQLWVPTAAEYEGGFQTKLYAAAILFGQPFAEAPCPTCGPGKLIPTATFPPPQDWRCPECNGRSVVATIEPSIGDRLQWVRASEVFPRFLREDGTIVDRSVVYSRADLVEFMGDLARIVRKVSQALEDRKWQAIRGTHCTQCPARSQCPLPQALRSHAGEINTLAQASEALEWADGQTDLVAATRVEAREFAKRLQLTIPVGRDEEYAFEVRESRKTNWDGLEEGVERARQFGEPFQLSQYVKPQTSTNFVKRKREVAADA